MKKLLTMFVLILMFSGLAQGRLIPNGSTDVTINFIMNDQTAGTRDVGIVIANLEMTYVEELTARSADVSNDLTHGAATDAHNDGECIHLLLGEYRTDWPDAAFDGGIGKFVTLTLKDGDGGAFTMTIEVELSAGVDAVSISGDKTAADNAENFWDETNVTARLIEVWETDYGTNYDTTLNMWNVDIEAVDGDTTAATNMEVFWDASTAGVNLHDFFGNATAYANFDDMYDGTGYAGGTIPTDVTLATNAVDADALKTDAITEIWNKAMTDMAAGAPSATASVFTAINYLYEAWRNVTKTTGAGEVQLYKDDGTTILTEADVSDDGTDFTKGEYRAE